MSNGENVAIRIRQCRRWTHPRPRRPSPPRHQKFKNPPLLLRGAVVNFFASIDRAVFIQTLLRKFLFAENFKCKWFPGLISWRPHSSFIKFKEKNFRRLLTSSIQREIRHFHSPSRAVTVKKCTKKEWCTCKVFVFRDKPMAVLEALVAVAFFVAKVPYYHYR